MATHNFSYVDTLNFYYPPLFGASPDYVVTQFSNGTPTGSFDVRKTTDLATVISSYALSNEFPDSMAVDNYGNAYVITKIGSTWKLKKMSVSKSGTISVSSGSTITVPGGTSSVGYSYLSSGGGGIVTEFFGNQYVTGYDTSDNSINWTMTTQSGHSSFAGNILSVQDNGWVILIDCSAHGAIETWVGRTLPTLPTLRGSIAYPSDAVYTPEIVPISTYTAFMAYRVDYGNYIKVGLLDTPWYAAPTWNWGPVEVPVNWTAGSRITTSARGNYVALAPDEIQGADASIYLVNANHGGIWESTPLPQIAQGAYYQGQNYMMVWSDINYLTFVNASFNKSHSLKHDVIRSSGGTFPPFPFAWSADF